MSALLSDPVGVTKEVISGFLEADGIGLAAEAAYRLVFALPALTILFASLSALAAEYTGVDVFQALLDHAQDAMPAEAFDTLSLVLDSVEQQSGFGILSIGLVIALWSGSNAMVALVKAINRAHRLEEVRGFVGRRLLALGLTVGLSLLVITGVVLFIFGQQLVSILGYGAAFSQLLNVVRIPIIILLFVAALAILYGFGPAQRMPLRATYPGALLATVLWIVGIWLFSLYLTFADPGSAYGVLGGILVLLLFLYISSIVVIVGAEINATLARRQVWRRVDYLRESHPIEVMSTGSLVPAVRTPPRVPAWVVVGILFIGAALGSLLRRKPPTN